MRFRNFVLGGLALLMTLLCLSARVAPEEPDFGLTPGERFPGREMEGFHDTLNALGGGPETTVIVTWRTDDGLSRAINAMLSHRSLARGVTVYSICLDDSNDDALLYAKADNVAMGTRILAASQLGRSVRRQLMRRGPQVFKLSSGLVSEVYSPDRIWLDGVSVL